jgi:N-acetyl-anhydromuramyl-L-alanine amidase AmpD
MRSLNKIIIHCADTYEDMDIGAEQIRKWHVEDNGWSDIGYHYVIRRNGVVEFGRPISKTGAHTKGHNVDSIGICLVGGRGEGNAPDDNFTSIQKVALRSLIDALKFTLNPDFEVCGHNEFSKKACPSFNAKKWFNQSISSSVGLVSERLGSIY